MNVEGSPEWLERYEYIEARSETYFDHYRGNPNYDFDKAGASVERQQNAVEDAYKRYAEGSLTVEGGLQLKQRCSVMSIDSSEHPNI